MPCIHLIHHRNHPNPNLLRQDPANPARHYSGYWRVATKTAAKLVGGMIYLHDTQTGEAHAGGRITGFTLQPSGEYAKRIDFEFIDDPAWTPLITDKRGWAMWRKIVWG